MQYSEHASNSNADSGIQSEALAALVEAVNTVLNCESFPEAAKAVFNSCKAILQAECGYVALLEPSKQQNQPVYLDSGSHVCTVPRSLPMPIRGLRDLAYKTKKVIIKNDFSKSIGFDLLPIGHAELKNVLFAPLLLNGQAVGLLGMANKKGGFTPADARLAQAFGELVSLALTNSHKLETIKNNEERLRQLTETASDAIFYTDEYFNIIFWNKAAERILGYSTEDALRQNASRLFMSDFEIVKELIIAGQCSEKTMELIALNEKMENVIVELSYSIWQVQEKTYYTFVLRDITAKKNLEKELKGLDRLHLLGQTAAGIAHEIRNPLTTVRGFLQTFLRRGTYPALNEYFELMIEELDHAGAIITEFTTLSHNKQSDFKRANLTALITAMAPLISAEALLKQLNVKLDLAPTPYFLFDEKEMRQLVLNLARNGLEAMDANGTLTVKIKSEITRVVVSIIDEGHGIDPQILDKLGTPFITTKDQGTGLGLAVCYSIVARHKGQIDVDTGSSGTCFKVCFTV